MKNEQIHIDHWLAVIVLYKETLLSSKTFISLDRSLKEMNVRLDVLVYDNSPQPAYTASDFALNNFNVVYRHDASNPGVSKAYNEGAALAGKKGKKYLLLLDQDTLFPSHAIAVYLQGILSHSEEVLFAPLLESPHGIYSPSKYFFRRGALWRDVSPGIYNLHGKTVLNSGVLICLSAYLEAGGYKESVRLYFSDFYFINRLRKKYPSFVVLDLVCQHELSDISRTSVDTSVRRFNDYCEGAINSAESFIDWILLFITVFLRAGLLSWRYKNLRFTSVFFRKFLHF